jgi:hypothetical protein
MMRAMAQITDAEVEEKLKAAKRKRDTAVGGEMLGLAILSAGIGLAWVWVGVAIFGLGVILLSLGLELS